ncbi:MAG: pantoate--beta-alanine ligase [Caldilineaceae bacterium]|nr:pantoate--beta-alanine ligase [Caldilineaceae bacterium]
MQIVSALPDLRAARASLSGSLGLVPTMGALHAGHMALVTRARNENDCVGASIFVNPSQFGPNEDLSKYPRPLERDLTLLKEAGVDLVWTPSPAEVYPPGFQTWVEVSDVSRPLEGTHRPGHFRGVATVVAKLFNAFTPDRAYFGQKDAQQVIVLAQMRRDLGFPLQMVVCPTVREADGLALSSRNVYLDPQERAAAPILYRALSAARAAYDAGERCGERLRAIMSEILASEPLARVDYVSAADPETLLDVESRADRFLLSMAVCIGRTRLIDNVMLGESDLFPREEQA